jgi:hypothetical protein
VERAQAASLRLVPLTGRIFFELTRVCERLDLFDAVVAENGAVLYFSRSGGRDLAPAPAPRLLAELGRRGLVYGPRPGAWTTSPTAGSCAARSKPWRRP